MTFDEAIVKAAEALDATMVDNTSTDRANTNLTAANTWVRIAELLHHREADNRHDDAA